MRRKTIDEVLNEKIKGDFDVLNTFAIAKIENVDNSKMMCSIKLLDMPEIMGTRDEVEVIENIPIAPLFWGKRCKMNAPLSVGDKVLIAFCQHDTFNARNSNEPIEPEYNSKFDINNAIVIGQISSDSEESLHSDDFYIVYGENIIKMNASSVEITAPEINLNGNVNISKGLKVKEDIKTEGDTISSGKSFLQHTNGGVPID